MPGNKTILGLTAQTLTVFLENVLNKRYTTPSSDIIAVLTGLDGVDALGNLVAVLETTIRSGRNCRWIRCGTTILMRLMEVLISGYQAEGCSACECHCGGRL